MNIVVRGPLLSISGYGNHARQVFRWLSEKTDHTLRVCAQILPWGITPWHINPEALDGLAGKIMEASAAEGIEHLDMSFQIQLPNEWDPQLAKFNVGITAGVETDICNPAWIDACNSMDLVVVPSHHTRDTLFRSGQLSVPVVVIPESFPDSIIPEKVDPFPLQARTSFNFLIFGQLTGTHVMHDRKNTFHAIKWLREEFRDDPDVGIILKTNHGRNTTIDRDVVRKILKQVSAELGQGPPIYLLHGAMDESEIAGLYRNPTIKALVAPTRGEGFGLPLLEAAASSLPVIATNWSGHLDFMNQGKWLKLDYNLQPVDAGKIDGQIFIENSKWAEVQEHDFKKKARKFYSKSATPQEWAGALRSSLLESHSFESIAKLWDSTVREYTT